MMDNVSYVQGLAQPLVIIHHPYVSTASLSKGRGGFRGTHRPTCLAAIVKFTQFCSKFPPTALLNFACDWLALDRDISFGRLTSPNV